MQLGVIGVHPVAGVHGQDETNASEVTQHLTGEEERVRQQEPAADRHLTQSIVVDPDDRVERHGGVVPGGMGQVQFRIPLGQQEHGENRSPSQLRLSG